MCIVYNVHIITCFVYHPFRKNVVVLGCVFVFLVTQWLALMSFLSWRDAGIFSYYLYSIHFVSFVVYVETLFQVYIGSTLFGVNLLGIMCVLNKDQCACLLAPCRPPNPSKWGVWMMVCDAKQRLFIYEYLSQICNESFGRHAFLIQLVNLTLIIIRFWLCYVSLAFARKLNIYFLLCSRICSTRLDAIVFYCVCGLARNSLWWYQNKLWIFFMSGKMYLLLESA